MDLDDATNAPSVDADTGRPLNPSSQEPKGNVDAALESNDSTRASLAFWADFTKRCICQRLDVQTFESYARIVHDEHPLLPAAVADLFLRPWSEDDYSLDPRVPPYLQVLSDLALIDAPSVLNALYRYSSLHNLVDGQNNQHLNGQGHGVGEQTTNGKGVRPRWKTSYWVEEVMFYRLCKAVHEGRAVRDRGTALEVVKVVSKWLSLFAQAASVFTNDVMAQSQNLWMEIESSKGGFVPMLLQLTNSPVILKAISTPAAKPLRRELSDNLAAFVPTLHDGTAKPITEKLEFFRTQVLASLDPVDKKQQADDAVMNEMIDSSLSGGPDTYELAPLPKFTTRVGMYIHLNAALAGRPLLDDANFFNYINNRYQNDINSAAIDLILGSFDVLANGVLGVYRHGGKEDAPLLRSFLINKVPLLLCQLFPAEFAATSAEMCITNALKEVDTNVFPTASQMFDESRNNNPYTESVREEFCAACVLHGLVNKDHVEAILGEPSMSDGPEKKSKDKLVQDFMANTIKSQDLLRDLDRMDGNVGAVCHGLVEIVRKLCSDKETMSLKLLCTELVQKPQSLDVLLLFETLPAIVGPICQLLDNWRYEDDQNEYQPVYEEFGAIILLVLAFVNRYDLSPSDIGLYSVKSSVRRIISQAHVNRAKEKLTEQEEKHVSGWILGLFDSEGGGLGDDLMSSCPPQEFYVLIAPLFHNIIAGYSHGHLNDESLKSGVEYLVDTFLLPSLVPAIKYLTDALWADQDDQKAIIKVLQLLLSPKAISNEASVMLTSVKKVVARPLDNALQNYLNKRDPKNQDVQPLLNALKDSIPMTKRTGYANMSEVGEWCKMEPHGLWTALRSTTQGLMHWAIQQPTNHVMPYTYTHRQFIVAMKLMGPDRILNLILEEVRNQTRTDLVNQPDQQRISVVHDVATALICAPNVRNEAPAPCTEDPPANTQQPIQRLLTLRDVLRLEADRCREIQKHDAVMADIVVHLYRRVEQQMTLPQNAPDMTQMMDANAGMGALDASGGMGPDVSLDAMVNLQGNGEPTLDLSGDLGGGLGGDLGGDLGGNGMEALQMDMTMGGDQDDIFGGINTDNMDDLDIGNLDWGDGGMDV